MDKIWYRNPFEVGGHWPLWRGLKNRMTMQNRQKSNAKNKTKLTSLCSIFIGFIPVVIVVLFNLQIV